MAYPFHQMPTIGEFIEAATTEFGAELVEIPRPDALPNEPTMLRYLRRVVGEKKLVSRVPLPAEDGERLLPTELWNHCRALEIPPDRFGLDVMLPDDW